MFVFNGNEEPRETELKEQSSNLFKLLIHSP